MTQYTASSSRNEQLSQLDLVSIWILSNVSFKFLLLSVLVFITPPSLHAPSSSKSKVFLIYSSFRKAMSHQSFKFLILMVMRSTSSGGWLHLGFYNKKEPFHTGCPQKSWKFCWSPKYCAVTALLWGKIFPWDKISDVVERRVRFASKTLTPGRISQLPKPTCSWKWHPNTCQLGNPTKGFFLGKSPNSGPNPPTARV